MSSPTYAYAWTGPEVDHLNDPALNSPQPCRHGAGCTYFGMCGFVHPGEEGTGRIQFEARAHPDAQQGIREQPACVRLIGNAGFYRRCRARMSWPEWCARNGIPYTPNPPRPRPVAEVEGDEVSTQPAQSETPSAAALSGAPVVAPPRGGAQRGRGAPRGRGALRGRGAPRAPRAPATSETPA